jgi:hypothetical protein
MNLQVWKSGLVNLQVFVGLKVWTRKSESLAS